MACRGRIWRRGRLAILAAAGMLFCGCGAKTVELDHAYDVYGTKIHYAKPKAAQEDAAGTFSIPYFAQELCVGENIKLGTKGLNAGAAKAMGVFHLSDGTITVSKNIYKKLYPASTTKILTAYLALKYGKLDDQVTVSAEAANQAGDSSVCGLREGDTLTLEELLYGLLLKSGNDAADAIAEYISGDEASFAVLMNEEARALGATHSRFVNPHGLQDKKHYTCVYDLYLLLDAALEYEQFETIIRTSAHTAAYKDANGAEVTQQWETTDRFLNGTAETPQGVEVIGGKTGTTSDAGYCLALYSKNASGEPIITIVLKADSSDNLYSLMAGMMER